MFTAKCMTGKIVFIPQQLGNVCFLFVYHLLFYLLFSHNKDYTSITLYKDVARGPRHIIIVVQLSESSRSPKIQIKFYERYFSVVMFILLYNFTRYSESVYQILKCNRLSSG